MDQRHQSPHYHSGIKLALTTLTIVLLSTTASAEVELQSKGMTVFGQSEVPKVLYIVPWKRKDAAVIEMPETASHNADVLDPIEQQIFRAQIEYYELMSERSKQHTN